jgi:protein-S-isoprenylcysteine O-methyltransferase Ste14
MGLDIRLPIGMFFTLLGILLAVFGFLSNPSLYAQSLGINVNLGWGIVLFFFGLLMLYLATRAMFFRSRLQKAKLKGKEPQS